MKPVRLLFLLLTLGMTAACNSNEEHSGDFGDIRVSDTRLLEQILSANQTEGETLLITTSGAWSSSITYVAQGSQKSSEEWLELVPDRGDAAGEYSLRILAQANESGSPRHATIRILCGASSVEISVTQTELLQEDSPVMHLTTLHSIVEYNGNEKSGRHMDFTFDEQGRLSAVIEYDGDAVERAHSFVYTGETQMRYTLTGPDGQTPVRTMEFEGTFSKTGNKVKTARCVEGDTEYNLDYQYNNYDENLLKFIVYTDPETKEEFRRDYYNWNNGLLPYCQTVQWRLNDDWTSEKSQSYLMDEEDPSVNKENLPYTSLLGESPIDIALLLVEDADIFHACGFYGKTNLYLPYEVITEQGTNRSVQRFTYAYEDLENIPATAGEYEGLRITVQESENGIPLGTKSYGVNVRID